MKINTNNNSFLQQIIKRMVEAGNPLKIVLFGSQARWTAKRDSDYDFLVIEHSDSPRYKRASKYRRALQEMGFSKDILVWTPDEIAEWKNVPNAFITVILKEGIIIYER